MGFDEPVTHSVPATLGPLTEAGRRLLDAYFRHEDDLTGGGIEHLVLAIEREAATRVEADLRARIEALRDAYNMGGDAVGGTLGRAIEALVAATEAPRCDTMTAITTAGGLTPPLPSDGEGEKPVQLMHPGDCPEGCLVNEGDCVLNTPQGGLR